MQAVLISVAVALAIVLGVLLVIRVIKGRKSESEFVDEDEQTDVSAFFKGLKKADEPPPAPKPAAETLIGAAPKLPTDDTSATVADVVLPSPAPADAPKVDEVKPAPATTAAVVTKPEAKPAVTAKVEPAPKPVIDKPAAQRTEPELETVTVVEDELPAWLIPIVCTVAFLVILGVFFS